ncbi:MAG: potassium transporter TrkG [Thiogranum sp.]|nr:potassium transporter TrkG [Thiogranum sp.]
MAGPSAIRGLRFAVRAPVIAKYLGQAFLALAALTSVPATVAAVSGNSDVALRYLFVILVFAIYGGFTARIRVPPNMQRNEALVITALVFTLSAVAMSFPLMGYGIAFIDALFEAVSGVTTTGLTTLGNLEERPVAFLFARAWLQWVGGLGVLALVLALLIEPGLAARRLGFGGHTDLVGGTHSHLRRVAQVYVIITIIGMLALLAAGESILDAIVHGLSAVSTGGFSNHDTSLAGVESTAAQVLITLLSLAGAISFSWYYLGYYRHLSSLLREPQFRALLVLCVASVVTLFCFMSMANPERVAENFADAAFVGISAQTTTGFSTLPLAELDAGSKLTLIVSMFIGGEVGSTSGGLKVLRLMVLLSLVRLLVQQTRIPAAGRIPATVGGSPLKSSEVNWTVALLVVYLLVMLLSWALFLASGHAPLDALFDVVSALSTSGLSTGVVSAGLDPALKAVLCLVMLMGRVEVIAVLVLLYPRTWLGRRRG